MTVHQPSALFEAQEAESTVRRNRGERPFELHPAIHLMTIGAYATFVGTLAVTFMGPDLVVASGILLISVVALFGTPALWARIVPDDGVAKQSWKEFLQEGVECATGRLAASAAIAQILVLPALIVCLGFVFVIIKATL
jgi:hypothetical protein